MEKLDLKTPSFTNENIAKLAELFPNCVTEKQNNEGKTERAIDFDLLRQEFSDTVVEGQQERYSLNWPGKREALVTANTPISKTLRPCRDESVDFDMTKNIFIEGDNLNALKLLRETYLNKIKMIYIDPPYNTGNDFVYKDNFTIDKNEYDKDSGQKNMEGGRLVSNPDSNGRFHSDWLSMIYPRLKLARNLLCDDGVIFISIDDNEQASLKRLCDEIFGEANFFCSFVWQKRSGSMDSVDGISSDHEYILAYGKMKQRMAGVRRTYEKYSNPDNDPRGPWISDNLSAGKAGGDVNYVITDPRTGNTFSPPNGRFWPYNPATMMQKIEEGRVLFPALPTGRPMLKRFKEEAKSQFLPVSSILRNHTDKAIPSNAILCAMNTKGTSEIQELFGGKIFSFPKSTILLKSLINQVAGDGDIILDFFVGSGTTAHAVMQLNSEDGLNRQCISVQLPEATEEKSDAHKAGYNNIAEISKERIRRAGKKIKEDNAGKDGIESLDIGFRVLKIDSSNMVDVHLSPDETKPDMFEKLADNIKDDRSSEDLLFQVLLDWGVDLSLPIEKEEIGGKETFFVDSNALVACFEEGIEEIFVKKLAEKKPLRVVFRDDGFASDSVRINVEQIFKLKSPDTDIRVI
jgi:adenine-specific DNA-methyltransferase